MIRPNRATPTPCVVQHKNVKLHSMCILHSEGKIISVGFSTLNIATLRKLYIFVFRQQLNIASFQKILWCLSVPVYSCLRAAPIKRNPSHLHFLYTRFQRCDAPTLAQGIHKYTHQTHQLYVQYQIHVCPLRMSSCGQNESKD